VDRTQESVWTVSKREKYLPEIQFRFTFRPATILIKLRSRRVNTRRFSRSVIPVVYIKTTVDQRSGKWQSKNTTIFVGTIIYQLHVSALIGHLQVGIQRQRKISIVSIGMGGRDLVYKHMGLEVEPILPQTPYICKRDLSPHTYTYNRYFRLTLYPNLKMEYQGRNM